MVKRPQPTEKEPQHLCLDAGYDNQMSRETVKEHHYQGRIRPARGKEPAREISASPMGRRKNIQLALEMSRAAGAL